MARNVSKQEGGGGKEGKELRFLGLAWLVQLRQLGVINPPVIYQKTRQTTSGVFCPLSHVKQPCPGQPCHWWSIVPRRTHITQRSLGDLDKRFKGLEQLCSESEGDGLQKLRDKRQPLLIKIKQCPGQRQPTVLFSAESHRGTKREDSAFALWGKKREINEEGFYRTDYMAWF